MWWKDTKDMKMICRGDIEADVSPDSSYLESYSATWADREIRECWCRSEICSPGMVKTPSHCFREIYLPADSPCSLEFTFGFRYPVINSAWNGDINSPSRLSIPLNFMLWWGRLLWGKNMCTPWTIIGQVVKNGLTIMTKIKGGKLWLHSIWIGKCNMMNTPPPTKSVALIWHKVGRESKREMIRILSKDAEIKLGILTVKRGEIIQRKHIKLCWWGIYEIEDYQCSDTNI